MRSHELEALIDGVPAAARHANSRPATGSSPGRGTNCAAGSESSGAFARSRRQRPRSGRTGLRSRSGLLDDDWTASWISPVESADAGYGKRPAHLLATEFALTGDVRSARLYATALGVYTATVNGERVGYRGTLARLDLVRPHPLRAGVRCHRHAASRREPARDRTVGRLVSRSGRRVPDAGRLGHALGARVELHIEHTDGTRRVIRSDETWTSRRSTIVRADLMDGQTVDFTAGEGTPSPCSSDAVDAPEIDWSPAPPVRVIESRAPRSIREIDGRRVGRRLRAERVGLDAADGPRPGGHAHRDRLRRARRR